MEARDSGGISLRPPAGMAAAARRGIELHEAGRSGDGLKPETVARAKRIAARENLTEAHVREMRAWFRRHKVDRRPGWSDPGKETPGYTAWMLWGGDAGWRWSEVKVARLDREAETESRGRIGRLKKQKKPKLRPGRPAKMGPSAGCGTGAGGFKAGNNCAKEDGIPLKPFSKGGTLKTPLKLTKADKAAFAAKAQKIAAKQAAKQAADKLTSIKAKKAKALIRKQQKDAKNAEAQKQADAAAAAKKKAMLQKIRVKKANEKLKDAVVGTPKSVQQELVEAKVKKAGESLKVVETPKSIAQEIAEAKAAAAAKTAATGKPAPWKQPAGAKDAVEPPKPMPDPKTLTIVKTLPGGSTGAQLATDPATGQQYVLKTGKSSGHIQNESQADDLYRAAGVNVPQQQVHDTPDGPKKVAEFIKGKTLQELKSSNAKQYEAAVAKIRKHFVADALFANYDVVGMNLDNIVIGKGGKVYRVDNGGSLTYRAQGKPKEFGKEVTELDSMRNSSVNSSAAGVFGTLTDKEIGTQIASLLKRKDAILAAAKTAELKSALEARMQFLAKWQQNQKNATKAIQINKTGHFGSDLTQPGAGMSSKTTEEIKQIFGAHNAAVYDPLHPHHGSSHESLKLRAAAKDAISRAAVARMEKAGIAESDIDDELLDLFKPSHDISKPPAGMERRYSLAAGMVDRWARTSGDSDSKAIGVQYAIADEFNVKSPFLKHFAKTVKLPAAKTVIDKIRQSKAVRAVLRAHYDETQAHFEKIGLKQITLVRGYGSDAKVSPDPQTGKQTVGLQPASSFSTSKTIAQAFSVSSEKGRLMTITVPANRILSTCVTGFGCLSEQEFTVLGGKISATVKKGSYW